MAILMLMVLLTILAKWCQSAGKEVAYRNTQTDKVEFEVYFSRYDVDVGRNIPMKFDVVHKNVGNGYNTSTGVFTAPASGSYLLYLQVTSEPGRGSIEAGMFRNDIRLCTAQASADKFDLRACHAFVHLTKGDIVFAMGYYGSTIVRSGNFAGILTYPDTV